MCPRAINLLIVQPLGNECVPKQSAVVPALKQYIVACLVHFTFRQPLFSLVFHVLTFEKMKSSGNLEVPVGKQLFRASINSNTTSSR